ncbi:hypothetical protein HYH02_009232 [Chlamydomonas schloesseri]|uniref:tRNA (guanine(46)-N(7))-methyltransferase n=1 Tax=Chlamydomonas schloesseri TaxID=2026947 RepID=A0A835WB05_9CHLO|nr:hypothetical protein HYH02_009232 [Chlamydomonas schloesseri]|eukprot:KAG2444034.1 hypothetical protein HYH02_009232 [Chlamydomonas schloesseri]
MRSSGCVSPHVQFGGARREAAVGSRRVQVASAAVTDSGHEPSSSAAASPGASQRAPAPTLPRWAQVKPADSLESPFRELELMELWDGTGKTRVRQHVNPLRREFQVPAAAPDWSAVFADPTLPLAVDIGSGYGRFLLLLQRNNPNRQINYLGIEIRRSLVDRSNEWVSRLGLSGRVHYVFANATVSLEALLAGYPGPLTDAFVQFPDPHFKRRHRKRRVVQRPLVNALAAAMPPGGRVLLQSDVEGAAVAMRNAFEAWGPHAFDLAPEHFTAPGAVFFSGAAAAPAASASAAAAGAVTSGASDSSSSTSNSSGSSGSSSNSEQPGPSAAATSASSSSSSVASSASPPSAATPQPSASTTNGAASAGAKPDYAAAAASAARHAMASAVAASAAVRQAEQQAVAAGSFASSSTTITSSESSEDEGDGEVGEDGQDGTGEEAAGPDAIDIDALESVWAAGGWLRDNPVGTPTEREHYVLQQGLPVYRVLLVRSIHKLLGFDSPASLAQPVRIGPALRLAKAEAPEQGYVLANALSRFIWDDYTRSFVALERCAVLSLTPSGDDTLLVSVLAGTPDNQGGDEQNARDGPGPIARFRAPGLLTSDHNGALYLVDFRRSLQCVIRKLQLPASLHAGTQQTDAVQQPARDQQRRDVPAAFGVAAAAPARPAAVAAATEAAAEAAAVVVSSMPLQAVWLRSRMLCDVTGIMHVPSSFPGGDCLVIASCTAVYRLPLGTWRPGGPPQEPQLLAGAADDGQATQPIDGRGGEARFCNTTSSLMLDGEGAVLLLDEDERGNAFALRRVSPSDGAVTTVASLPALRANPAAGGLGWAVASLLSNGAICAIWMHEGCCELYNVGLTPPAYLEPAPPAAAPGGGGLPPPRSLPADLGALLDAQPDGTADVTIRVGERRFHAHRAILSARCDYFKQRLAGDGGFADSRAAELELPDADPDAFALVLRWLYTGGAHIPAEQARGVAGLADRLLLPELCDVALEVMVETLAPETVVDSLLWAAGCCESRGGSFTGLLEQLKGWYVSHHEGVWRDAKPSVRRLMEARSDLACELVEAQQQQQQQQQECSARRQRV